MKKIKILFISRIGKKKISGMSISSQNIIYLLQKSGCELINISAEDMNNFLYVKYDDIDLIWFYEDTKFDINYIYKLSNLYENNVPIISNIQNTNSFEKKRYIFDIINDTKKNNKRNIFFGVFTEESRDFLGEYKEYIFPIPKTIRNFNMTPNTFEKRCGILLGEYNKMLNPKITNNFNTFLLIKSIRERFDDIPLFAYKHYNLDINHSKNPYNINSNKNEIEYIDNNIKCFDYREDLIDEINKFRIYISNVSNETFAMVPAESQSTGICVMYRHMPQSLTPHIYYSGYLWYNIPDLLNAIEYVYYDKEVWNSISQRSIKNYYANNIDDLHHILRLQLEKVIITYKSSL
jgi:hypothetical protein